MADAFLLENGVDRYLLENGVDRYITEAAAQTVSPAALSLTLTPVAPQVRLRWLPGAISLSLVPLSPTVIQAQSVSPASLGLTLSVLAPQVLAPVRPGALTLALGLPVDPVTGWGSSPWGTTQFAMGTGRMQILSASAAPSLTLTLSVLAPRLEAVPLPSGIRLGITPLTSSTYWGSAWGDPYGSVSGEMRVGLSVAPASLGLSLGLPAPEVAQGVPASQVEPAALVLTLTVLAPSITSPISPAAMGLTLTVLAPVITRGVSPDHGFPVLGALTVFEGGSSESELVGAGATSSWGDGGNTT